MPFRGTVRLFFLDRGLAKRHPAAGCHEYPAPRSRGQCFQCPADVRRAIEAAPRQDSAEDDLRSQQYFHRPAFVHGPVSFRGVLEGKGEVEDQAGIDGPVPDQVDQFG